MERQRTFMRGIGGDCRLYEFSGAGVIAAPRVMDLIRDMTHCYNAAPWRGYPAEAIYVVDISAVHRDGDQCDVLITFCATLGRVAYHVLGDQRGAWRPMLRSGPGIHPLYNCCDFGQLPELMYSDEV